MSFYRGFITGLLKIAGVARQSSDAPNSSVSVLRGADQTFITSPGLGSDIHSQLFGTGYDDRKYMTLAERKKKGIKNTVSMPGVQLGHLSKDPEDTNQPSFRTLPSTSAGSGD